MLSAVKTREEKRRMAVVKVVDMCLEGGKKLKKSEISVQCTVCRLWCHRECSGISNYFLKCKENRRRIGTNMAYWACRPCTAYAQGMNNRLKEMEKRLDATEDKGKQKTDDIASVEKRTEKLEKRMEKLEKKLESKASRDEEAMHEELRERDAKLLNVIMHGMVEPDD